VASLAACAAVETSQQAQSHAGKEYKEVHYQIVKELLPVGYAEAFAFGEPNILSEVKIVSTATYPKYSRCLAFAACRNLLRRADFRRRLPILTFGPLWIIHKRTYHPDTEVDSCIFGNLRVLRVWVVSIPGGRVFENILLQSMLTHQQLARTRLCRKTHFFGGLAGA